MSLQAFPYLSLLLMFISALFTARIMASGGLRHSGRIGFIDGLRGYLALAVIGSHFLYEVNFAAWSKWEAPEIFIFHSLGAIAVTCFFMITGMLFYKRTVLDDRRVGWIGLYRGRVLRLTPAYALAALCIFVIASYMSGRLPSFDRSNAMALISWATFTLPGQRKINDYAGTGYIVARVTWTLCYEWVFYLILPFINAIFKPLKHPFIRMGLLAVLIVASYSLPPLKVLYFESRIATIFLFGMLAAEVIGRGATPLLTGTLGSVLGVAVLFGSFWCENYSVPQVALIFVFFLTVAQGNSYWGCFSRSESVLLGDASYSIYLLHGVVLFLLTQIFINDHEGVTLLHWLLLPAAGALTAVLSITIFTVIERPFISMGKPSVPGPLTQVAT